MSSQILAETRPTTALRHKQRLAYEWLWATSRGYSAGRGVTIASSDFTAGFGLDRLGVKATPSGPVIESILNASKEIMQHRPVVGLLAPAPQRGSLSAVAQARDAASGSRSAHKYPPTVRPR